VHGGPPTDETQPDWRSTMIDVSGLSLSELAAEDDDTALANALRRVAANATNPNEPIAGFNSAL
jgi:FXSXX-COOH protein